MTIHRDWIHEWKRENPQGFTKELPEICETVFLDGQILLMKNGTVRTWTDYIKFQFLFRIRRYFNTGAKTVVLAFDNYDHVPAAKGMTQAKRRKHLPPVHEDPYTPLPPFIPDEWDVLIMNRVFKTKVIKLIIEKMPELVRLYPGQRLVLDYAGNPIAYTMDGMEVYEDLPGLGESDVKFTRYVLPGKTFLVDATDGDYLPIALMRHERMLSQHLTPPRVYVYRMECKLEGKGTSAPHGARGGQESGNQSTRKRVFEYVSVAVVYTSIRRKIASFENLFLAAGPQEALSPPSDEMRIIAGLIAITGCDFTKGLAQISPKRIWGMLPVLWKGLKKAYNPETKLFDPRMVTDLVIARLYSNIYARHIAGESTCMESLSRALKAATGLSQSTRDKLPDMKNVMCIARNSNWVLEYWTCPLNGEYPDPMSGDFGFSVNHRGVPQWEDDETPAPAPKKRRAMPKSHPESSTPQG